MGFRPLARVACALLLSAATAAVAAGPRMLASDGPPGHSPEHGFQSLGHRVKLNQAQLSLLRFGDETDLALPNGALHTFVVDLVQQQGDGITSFVAHLKGRGTEYRAIITTGPNGSMGVIGTPEGEFRIVPGDGNDWLVDMAAEQIHHGPILLDNDAKHSPITKELPEPGLADAFVAIPGMNVVGMTKAAPSPQYGVDIMFVLTQGLATRLGGNLMVRLNQLVTMANTAYADSDVAITLRLVGVTVVNFSDTATDDTALSTISPTGTTFDAATFGTIEAQRTANGADVVAFMRDGSSFGGSGLAWVGRFSPANGVATVLTNPINMYSVITGCVLGCESVFIHEVGHNMGNLHDRDTELWQRDSNPTSMTEQYAYGYAHCDVALSCAPGTLGSCTTEPECSTPRASSNNFSEIMAYFHATTLQNLKFSNPNITCKGTANTSLPCGVPGTIDAARAMNERRAAISAAKGTAQTPPIGAPSSLQFTASSFTVPESGGSVNVTVSRLGSTAGAVSVQYATSNGSATAGSDYTAASGTLTWLNGDAANKTIAIPIANDAIVEGNESFTVTLSNPTGGAFLGSPSTISVFIAEPWPVGGTMPTGFTTVSGSSWAIANDTSSDGDGVSLKSGVIFPCPPTCGFASVPLPSTLQFTGTFVAGTVSFDYKVNSYPSNGFFEFLMDGSVVSSVSASGDSGWLKASIAISAGSHTLQWRYRPTLTFACSGALPAPPQGAACADRAWIDSVDLPLAPTGPFLLTVARAGTGTGSVTSAAAGISCGIDCTESYPTGTSVTLTAVADAGSSFSGWSGGGCVGTGTCVVAMNAVNTVTARFDTGTNIPRLFGISTRANVLTGNNVTIAGFIIGGSAPKTVVVRARGPSLGIAGAMANPTLTLVPADGSPSTTNDDWQTAGNAAQLIASGFQPGDPKDAAIMATLAPGAYTAVVSGVGGTTGVAIVEVYELDHPEIPTVAISTRGLVQTGNNVMIGGFIIQGSAPQTVVVRARGPSTGVAGALADPTLTIVPADGSPAMTNDDWQTAPNAAQLQAIGMQPGNAKESALLVTLSPGAYTAVVSGSGGTTGVGIIEVYAQ